MNNPQAQIIPVRRELLIQAADALYHLDRVTQMAQTVAFALKRLSNDSIIKHQADLLLYLLESAEEMSGYSAKGNCYDLNEAIEQADKEQQKTAAIPSH